MINHILKYYFDDSSYGYILLEDRDISKINISLIADSCALFIYDLDLTSSFNKYSKEQLDEIFSNNAINLVKIHIGQRFSKEEFVALNYKDEEYINMCDNVKVCINQKCKTHTGVVKLINRQYRLLILGERVILHLGQLKGLGVV